MTAMTMGMRELKAKQMELLRKCEMNEVRDKALKIMTNTQEPASRKAM